MHSPLARIACLVATLASPTAFAAANQGAPAPTPIPAHELNMSPAFGGYSGDLTLVSSRTQRLSVSSLVAELDGARKALAAAEARLKQLEAQREATLARLEALTLRLKALEATRQPALTPQPPPAPAAKP